MNSQKILICPSLLSCDFGRLKDEIQAVEKAGADWLHVDVMDGHFVDNITIGIPLVEAIKKYSKIPVDVHLMISEPQKYVERFVKAGSDVLSFHLEAYFNPGCVAEKIRKAAHQAGRQVKIGVALNPDTPAASLREVVSVIDMVLVMTVYPGYSGQEFIGRATEKISDILGLSSMVEIQVDGGIKPDNIHLVARKGANIFVAGNAVFKSADYAAAIATLRKNAEKAYGGAAAV